MNNTVIESITSPPSVSPIQASLQWWRNIKRDYEAFANNLKDLEIPVPEGAEAPPFSKEELLEKRTASYQEERNKNFEDIRTFVAELKKKLDGFASYDEAFMDHLKDCDEPECEKSIHDMVCNIQDLRHFLTVNCFNPEDPTGIADVVSVCRDLELEDEYVDIVEKFYVDSASGDVIIKAFC